MANKEAVMDPARQGEAVALALEEHLRLWLRDLLEVRQVRDVTIRTCSVIDCDSAHAEQVRVTATAVSVGRDRAGDVVALAQAGADALPRQLGGTGKFLDRDVAMHMDRMRCLRSEQGHSRDYEPHGIVDRARVRIMFLREDEQALALLRWAVS